MKRSPPAVHQIELRIADIDAQEFLESWAMEFPQGSHFRVIVHIEHMPKKDPAPLVTEAIHNYFEYKAVLTKRNLRLLLQEGRTSLLIGLCFLTLCLITADFLSSFSYNTFLRVLKESLLIGGWVAMWRPMQIFLYDWWPMIRRSRIYSNLGRASVHVSPGKTL